MGGKGGKIYTGFLGLCCAHTSIVERNHMMMASESTRPGAVNGVSVKCYDHLRRGERRREVVLTFWKIQGYLSRRGSHCLVNNVDHSAKSGDLFQAQHSWLR